MPAPAPRPQKMSKVVRTLLKPALTSHFQCWFYPTPGASSWMKERGFTFDTSSSEFISLSCADASLPGSSLITNEITSDYHGVTEKHVYRKQFDDRADFTFYVDHNSADPLNDNFPQEKNSYDIIWFFENWISYIADESNNAIGGKPSGNSSDYFYRTKFPKDYQTEIYITKFERDYTNAYLNYTFLQAFPIAINSMPVTYESSQLLKCNVSFSYTRYQVSRTDIRNSLTNI
jgi:hypothetical protein